MKAIILGNGRKAEWVLGMKFSSGEFRVEQGNAGNVASDAVQAAEGLAELISWISSLHEDVEVYCYEMNGTFDIDDHEVVFVKSVNDLKDKQLDELWDSYN